MLDLDQVRLKISKMSLRWIVSRFERIPQSQSPCKGLKKNYIRGGGKGFRWSRNTFKGKSFVYCVYLYIKYKIHVDICSIEYEHIQFLCYFFDNLIFCKRKLIIRLSDFKKMQFRKRGNSLIITTEMPVFPFLKSHYMT